MDFALSKINILETVCLFAGSIGNKLKRNIDQPVFVVGTGRCGSSLLIRILESHPEIVAFPSEANWLWHPGLYPFKKARIPIQPIEIDPKRFTKISIGAWPPNQEYKIRNIINGFHLIKGKKKILFVKSAMISIMIPKIIEIFPDSKFIHVYRLGPSVVESYFKKNFSSYLRYIYNEADYRLCCAKYWNDCILEIERAKAHPRLFENNNFLEFSYESLCQNPRALLESLAVHIGVSANDFAFDISTIMNMNYKVGDYFKNENWSATIEAMYPAMKLKGYIQ